MAVDYSNANYDGSGGGSRDYMSGSGEMSLAGFSPSARATLLNSVTSVYFDTLEELLWVGQDSGHHTSFYGKDMEKYSSVQVNLNREPVLQTLTFERGVLSLCKDSLNLFSRFGRGQDRYSCDAFQNMRCMMQSGASNVMVGGDHSQLLDIDISQMKVTNEVAVDEPGVSVIKRNNRFVISGNSKGKIVLRDPQTLRIEGSYSAHSGEVLDIDFHRNLIVSCGCAVRMGQATSDKFLMLYDMRMMRTTTPLVCSLEPRFVRFLPTFSERLAVASHNGQFQLVDVAAVTAMPSPHYDIGVRGPVTSFDISPSRNALAFGDESGCVLLLTQDPDAPFSGYSRPTEFADPVEHHPHVPLDNARFPLASIPVYYPEHGSLLSDWPEALSRKVYRKPEPIPAQVLNKTQWKGDVGHGPGSENRKPNQHPYKLTEETSTRRRRIDSVPESPIGRGDDPFVSVPKKYRKVEIKYSKLGVEDFDFRHYNKTNFAGLEIHIPNAYCNCMLQILYYVEPLRTALLSHICQKEFCLACELGFLFHMLDISKGKTCQASNFLRAFRTIPEASALGLVLGDDQEFSTKTDLPRIIHSWIRFVLQQVHLDITGETPSNPKPKQESVPQQKKPKETAGKRPGKVEQAGNKGNKGKGSVAADSSAKTAAGEPPAPTKASKDSVASSLFRTLVLNHFKCTCGAESTREHNSYVFDMSYPSSPVDVPDFEFGPVPFTKVLSDSVNSKLNTQSWCSTCEKYQPHTQKKTLTNLPDVMSINCRVDSDNSAEFWRRQIELLKKDAIAAPQSPAPAPAAQPKPCRYGDQCTRGDCRFWHQNRPSADTASTKPTQRAVAEVSWAPQMFAAKLNESGAVVIKPLGDSSDDSAFGGGGGDNPEVKLLEKEGYVVYELLSSIANIREKETTHLVSSINVTETYHQRKEGITTRQTYLFNDFSIVDIEKKEVSQFNLEWKRPCALFYQKRRLNEGYNLKVENQITASCLLADSASRKLGQSLPFTPLEADELPKKGEFVGLDAEFVSLYQEEAELRSDGTQSTIKPSQMSVARITCLRGFDGSRPLVPFMDDYISTQEAVADYLTKFSGIKPGDLDASVSSKRLTTLKSTYQKLRFLADIGVVFVGHGLKKDFRVINIVLPKEQIVDTVDLFHLHRQRMISLKFLAWYFLDIKIQKGMHDSVEDASTALQLHRKCSQLKEEGNEPFHQAVQELYNKGRIVQWKIPDEEEQSQLEHK